MEKLCEHVWTLPMTIDIGAEDTIGDQMVCEKCGLKKRLWYDQGAKKLLDAIHSSSDATFDKHQG